MSDTMEDLRPDAAADAETAARQPEPWTRERIARLGFLVGLGWDAQRVAQDPIVASTRGNVHRQVQRFGLAFRDAANMRLPPSALGRLGAAAAKRGLRTDALIRALLVAAASDGCLIDNILDDGA